MILFDNVTITEQQKTILSDVSFTMKRGEKLVLHGPSGSGKSTILRSLLGAHIPASGTISFDGQQITRRTIQEVRSNIAFIGQEPFLGDGSVEDALLLPFGFRVNNRRRPDKEALQIALKQVDLPSDMLSAAADKVSGGEKQRLAIARALLLGNSIYCIDEATSALDADNAEAIIRLFQNPDFSILSVSHDPRWFAIASRFLHIEKGRIIQDATDHPYSIKNQEQSRGNN